MIIDDFFPEKGKLVLNANGREFIEKIGVETAKKVILAVLKGENIRSHTEPLTLRRVAIATGAIIYLFVQYWSELENSSENIPRLAFEQMSHTPQSKKDTFWPAQWLVGLTGKSIQNVLRSDLKMRESYIQEFVNSIEESAIKCKEDFGEVSVSLGYILDNDKQEYKRVLDWKDLIYLSTAIGSTTLTIRGSEKSTYGKLFERLVLGAALSILGFQYVENSKSKTLEKVFWLSDSSSIRECDATIRLRPGKLAKFDIGFIGKGNPEIMKDKLTRFNNEVEQDGIANFSQTFIIVDKMPATTKTLEAAKKSGSEIIQMSMQIWLLELAEKLKCRLDYTAEILSVPQNEVTDYICEKLNKINILNFLNSNEKIKEFSENSLFDDEEE